MGKDIIQELRRAQKLDMHRVPLRADGERFLVAVLLAQMVVFAVAGGGLLRRTS
jgi:hypothetical protein